MNLRSIFHHLSKVIFLFAICRQFYSIYSEKRKLPVTSPYSINAFGTDWFIKDSNGVAQLPGPCVWKKEGIHKDNDGIHLVVKPYGAGCTNWASCEVWSTKAFGYGTYLYQTTGPFDVMDDQVTFGLFIWDDDCPGDCHFREVDFEIGRWGNPNDANAMQAVVQPWTEKTNIRRFCLANAKKYGSGSGSGACDDYGSNSFGNAAFNKITLVMQWYDKLLRFIVFDGFWNIDNLGDAKGSLLGGWDFPYKERIPKPGDERVHLNLWQANWGGVPRNGRMVHVVVNNFQHKKDWIDLSAMGINVPSRLLHTEAENLPEDVLHQWQNRSISMGNPYHDRSLFEEIEKQAESGTGTGTGDRSNVNRNAEVLTLINEKRIEEEGRMIKEGTKTTVEEQEPDINIPVLVEQENQAKMQLLEDEAPVEEVAKEHEAMGTSKDTRSKIKKKGKKVQIPESMEYVRKLANTAPISTSNVSQPSSEETETDTTVVAAKPGSGTTTTTGDGTIPISTDVGQQIPSDRTVTPSDTLTRNLIVVGSIAGSFIALIAVGIAGLRYGRMRARQRQAGAPRHVYIFGSNTPVEPRKMKEALPYMYGDDLFEEGVYNLQPSGSKTYGKSTSTSVSPSKRRPAHTATAATPPSIVRGKGDYLRQSPQRHHV